MPPNTITITNTAKMHRILWGWEMYKLGMEPIKSLAQRGKGCFPKYFFLIQIHIQYIKQFFVYFLIVIRLFQF